MSIRELSGQMRSGKLSPVDLTRECLQRIAQHNATLNAFITVTAESALNEARQAEQEIRAGTWRGPLHGIPIGVKDLIDTAGVLTTAASRQFATRIPAQDAEVVRRLRQAGAVLVGKHNAHEFAYGGSSVISAYGPVRNPWNTECISGGSSGGSTAAVASGMCYAAIGTDTSGSIREPAALCSVVGLKPTYGLVSAEGVIPLSWSLDHVGPITRSVDDAALVLEAIASPNPAPVNSLPVKRGKFGDLSTRTARLRVGVPRRFFFEDLDAEVSTAVEEALRVLGALASETRELTLDPTLDRTLSNAESYRYHESWVKNSPELYQAETLRRILNGAGLTPGQEEAAKADLQRRREEVAQVFEQVDVLVTPATPIPAPTLASLESDMARLREHELVLLHNTRPFNAWGLPAVSVPCGFTRSGLPIGLQIAGAHWREDIVLGLAAAYERATEWHTRRAGL